MKGILRSGLVAVWLVGLFSVGLFLPLPEAVVRAQPPGSKPLTDNAPNPTVPGQASYNMCFDGTTWDRCASSTVSEGTHDTAAPGAPIGLFLMGKANDSTPTAVSSGDAVALRSTTTGALVVASVQSGIWDVRGTVYAGRFGRLLAVAVDFRVEHECHERQEHAGPGLHHRREQSERE